MALINCPECGREKVSDSAEMCPDCGYGIKAHFEKIHLEKVEVKEEKTICCLNEPKINKIKKEKPIKVIHIFFIVMLICSCFIFFIVFYNAQKTKEKLNEIEGLVKNEEFIEAWKKVDKKILNEYRENEYVDKAIVVGIMEYDYEEAQNKSSNVMDYFSVVLRSIGAHQKLIDWGLYDYTESMVLDSVQKIENHRDKIFGDTVEEMILKKYNDPENTIVEPYRTENPDGAEDYIQFLISSIDENKTQEYEKEKYNKNNPLQVIEKSVKKDGDYWYCNGTLSNVDSKAYYYVKVKVTYFDENMNVLTTDWTYAVDSVGIKGGENQQFELMTKVNGKVDKYKVEIIGYK